jgi:hypothetical protein
MFKNTSNQKLRVFAFNSVNGEPQTGDADNITCKLSIDNGPLQDLEDINPVETEDGYYLFDLTKAETNGNFLDFYPDSSTVNVVVIVPNYNRQTTFSYTADGTASSGIEEMLIVLRGLVQDLDQTIYTDYSLIRLLITSSIMTQKENDFPEDYIIDISSMTIDPNPTDNSFILLTAYKAAILLIQSELRKYSSQTIKIVDGPSSIDMSGISKNFIDLLKSLREDYNRIKMDYSLSGNIGYAVITPTTVEYIRGNNFS